MWKYNVSLKKNDKLFHYVFALYQDAISLL